MGQQANEMPAASASAELIEWSVFSSPTRTGRVSFAQAHGHQGGGSLLWLAHKLDDWRTGAGHGFVGPPACVIIVVTNLHLVVVLGAARDQLGANSD